MCEHTREHTIGSWKMLSEREGYDVVYQLWANNKPAVAVDHLTDDEVNYLMNLFGEK